MAEALYVARDSDRAALESLWDAAKGGTPSFLRLQAPFGGGKRALVGELARDIAASADDALLWRVTCLDQENGLQWLVRMYGSLMASLGTDVLRRGKVEMILNSQLPNQPKRVQGWYRSFVAAMKESKTDREKGAVQLKLPQDNPLIGLIEIVTAISRRMPILLEIQSPSLVYSIALTQFVEGLFEEVKGGNSRLMLVLHDEEPTPATHAMWPMPLVDLFERRPEIFRVHALGPWGADEVGSYLASKGLQADTAGLVRMADGRPGFVAELVDILQERGLLGGDLAGLTLPSLLPLELDEEIDEPEPVPEGQRRKAGPSDVDNLVYFAALLGQAFPSGLVADMGGWERDSVDDLIDALGGMFEEVQFADDLQTWIYKFKRGSFREGVIAKNATDEGHELARRVGMFMERFLVPRGYGFIGKTARVYGEHGALQRASALRVLALSNDAQDVWGLGYDLMKYFDEVQWPAALQRTVFTNLLDRLVATAPVQTVETVYGEVQTWATAQDDKDLAAWLLYTGSRLDARRQDFYRARDRANEAIKLYTALDNKLRVADVYNHLAVIELQDGKLDAALEYVEKAVESGTIESEGNKLVPPAVLAHAEHVRGLVARRNGQLEPAAEHFRRANEVAGNAGIGPLALESGLSFGEALLAGGQLDKARDVLRRVHQIAVQLGNPLRERGACELLAQAEGALKNYDAAIQLGTRVLQLSEQLKLEQIRPIDQYNLGFFYFAKGSHADALRLFEQAEHQVATLGNHPVVKELYYFMGLAYLGAGKKEQAKVALRNGLRPAQRANDLPKMVSALDHLAQIEAESGNAAAAKKLLEDAIGFASQANLKEARKTLQKKLGSLPA